MKSNRWILALGIAACTWMVCDMRAHADALKPYASLSEAAVDALNDAEAFAPGFEAGGTLYKCGETYAYVAPVTQHRKVGVDVDSYASPRCVLVAFYHTHPKGDGRFSGLDIATTCNARVRSFIKPAGGSVRVFDCEGLPPLAIRAVIASDVLSRGRSI